MICKTCGAELKPDASFCHFCGTQYAIPVSEPVQVNYQPVQKKSNTGLIVAVVVMGIIIVAGFAAIIGYIVGNNSNQMIVETEAETQLVEEATQPPETTTAAPVTAAPSTSAKQTVPTFTYNDNNTHSSQFLFDSANQYITRSYLATCTRDEVTIILNEMYARHGYIFKDAELREYFNSQSWYVGYTTSMEEAASYFNSVESANLNTIYEYMKDMGWRD